MCAPLRGLSALPIDKNTRQANKPLPHIYIWGFFMAIYHLHVSMVKRSTGRSAVAAAAYRAGEKMRNERDGIIHDYTRKKGVSYSEIMLPENAPSEFKSRATLWNAVEKAEKRSDSQTSREFDIALPVEFDKQEQVEIMREYIQDNFVDKGMCADFAIHDECDTNPHAHIMLTTRKVNKNGFGGKNRDWNDKALLETWRKNWADICNERLQAKGLDERIDHRTLEAQGIDREPTIHEGRNLDRIRENQEIIQRNIKPTPEATAKDLHDLKQGYYILDKEICMLKQQAADMRREMQFLRHKAEDIEERAEQIKIMTGRQYEQAANYFKRTYYISPDEAAAGVRLYEDKIKQIQREQELLKGKLTPLVEEHKAFAFEFQRLKLLAEINPEGQKTLDELVRLERENMPQSVKGCLAWAQAERELNAFVEKNFGEILKQVPPKKARAIIGRLECERARETKQVRNFLHNR
jgi:hypothetical protein